MSHNKLKFHRLLLYLTAVAFLMAQTQARPAMLVNSYSVDSFDDSVGDPLSPNILGESMSMPLPLWMVHAAINAGITKDSKALYAYDDGLGGYAGSSNEVSTFADSGTTPAPKSGESDLPEQSMQNVNLTGTWTLDLVDQIQRHLDLVLVQNKEAVLGQGTLIGPNGTQRVTASGSLIGGRLDLTAMPVDSLDLYKLDLSTDPSTNGSYTAYSTSGDTWSGDVSGSAPSGILNSVPKVSRANAEPDKGATVLGLARPAQMSGGTSSSTSVDMSSVGGTDSTESYSSTSESIGG